MPYHPLPRSELLAMKSTAERMKALLADGFVPKPKEKIVELALEAFWAVVAENHPEILSGDGDATTFAELASDEIDQWVSNNTVEIECPDCGLTPSAAEDCPNGCHCIQ